MAKVNNSLAPQEGEGKRTFTQYLSLPKVKDSLVATFQDTNRVMMFTSSLASAVSTNPSLAKCEHGSIVATGLVADALKLSLSPQLGFCYGVPFEQKEKRDKNGNIVQHACVKATFVMGYRGYIQLAIRSGYYRDIDVIEIRQGEYLGRDATTGKQRFSFITDDEKRDSLPIIGYMAYFEQVNGFRKTLYWSKEKMLKHADRYSPAFSYYGDDYHVPYEDYEKGNYNKKDEWRYSSFWYKDFDQMAFKTMLRQLISKWGIMSLEMQTAFENDDRVGRSDFSDAHNLTEPMDDELNYDTGEIIAPLVSGSKRLDGIINGDTGEVIKPTQTVDDIFD